MHWLLATICRQMLLLLAVRVVLEAVCILKGIKPVRFKDPQSGQMVDSYWEASKKMLMDEEFLLSLRYIFGLQSWRRQQQLQCDTTDRDSQCS